MNDKKAKPKKLTHTREAVEESSASSCRVFRHISGAIEQGPRGSSNRTSRPTHHAPHSRDQVASTTISTTRNAANRASCPAHHASRTTYETSCSVIR